MWHATCIYESTTQAKRETPMTIFFLFTAAFLFGTGKIGMRGLCGMFASRAARQMTYRILPRGRR